LTRGIPVTTIKVNEHCLYETVEMICPSCHSEMIVIEYDRIEIDYCIECSGIWFDTGELELLLGPSFSDVIDKLYEAPEADAGQKGRKCPTCGKKMKVVRMNESSSLFIDMCPNKGGIWLDGGEINELASQLSVNTFTEKTGEGADPNSLRIFSFIKNVIKPAS